MTPSDLYPMSTTTESLPTLITVPETMSPSLSSSVLATDASNRLANDSPLDARSAWVEPVILIFARGLLALRGRDGALGDRVARRQRLGFGCFMVRLAA